MIYFIKKKIGKETYQFSVEGKNLHECIMNAKKLSFHDLEKCGLCGSPDLELDARLAQKKFEYTFVKCRSCKGYLNFGQQVEDDNIFYFRDVETGKTDQKTGKQIKKLDWKDSKTKMDDGEGNILHE